MNDNKPNWTAYLRTTVQMEGIHAKNKNWDEQLLTDHMTAKGATPDQIQEAVDTYRAYNPVHGSEFDTIRGKSLRDDFAGQALIGLLSGPTGHDWLDAARKAYKIADAMLLERRPAPEANHE